MPTKVWVKAASVSYKLTPPGSTCPPAHFNQYSPVQLFGIFRRKKLEQKFLDPPILGPWAHRHPLRTTCLTWNYVLTLELPHIVKKNSNNFPIFSKQSVKFELLVHLLFMQIEFEK